MQSIISFDCGNRSLSFTILLGKEGKELYIFDTADLTDGKPLDDSTVHARTSSLKTVLCKLDKYKPFMVLIENQPKI